MKKVVGISYYLFSFITYFIFQNMIVFDKYLIFYNETIGHRQHQQREESDGGILFLYLTRLL